MNLPGTFSQTIENTFGERGRLFLHELPTLLEEAVQRWHLSDLCLAEQLSYNFVAYALRGNAEVVLKLGVPDRELTSEAGALRYFAGRGAVHLLDADPDQGMLLLERLRPGELLASVPDDREATRIASDVMRRLWRADVADPRLIRLGDWFQGLERFRTQHGEGTGALDAHLFEQAQTASRDFFAEDHSPTLIHGDLHHFNILSSERGWLAIDPKGVIGPAAYEVGPFLINPWAVVGLPSDAPRLMRDRVAILSEALTLEKERICKWGLAHAVLSAVWSFEDNEDWRPAMECARILAALDH